MKFTKIFLQIYAFIGLSIGIIFIGFSFGHILAGDATDVYYTGLFAGILLCLSAWGLMTFKWWGQIPVTLTSLLIVLISSLVINPITIAIIILNLFVLCLLWLHKETVHLFPKRPNSQV